MAWLHALYAVEKHFHWVATTSAVLTYNYYLRTALSVSISQPSLVEI